MPGRISGNAGHYVVLSLVTNDHTFAQRVLIAKVFGGGSGGQHYLIGLVKHFIHVALQQFVAEEVEKIGSERIQQSSL